MYKILKILNIIENKNVSTSKCFLKMRYDSIIIFQIRTLFLKVFPLGKFITDTHKIDYWRKIYLHNM